MASWLDANIFDFFERSVRAGDFSGAAPSFAPNGSSGLDELKAKIATDAEEERRFLEYGLRAIRRTC
jgi:hypothetical protein